MVTAAIKSKEAASWQESYDKHRQCAEKQRLYSVNKGLYSQGYGLPRCHLCLWNLDGKEGREPNNWCLWTVVLEKTPESPLDSKIKPVNLKGNQPWIVVGRTDAETEAPVLWSLDVKSQLIGKDCSAEKYWGQKEKRASEDEMAGWQYWCNGHELEQTSGDSEGQGGLACCSPWDCRESDMTRQLNNNNSNTTTSIYVLVCDLSH